jgi:arabinofuranan 3-O-arabinosyltransferase
MTFDSWWSNRWPTFGRAAEYTKSTLGWSLLLIVIFCVLGYRYLVARREGRLDQGIDPAYLLDPPLDTVSPADEAETATKH